MKTMESVPASTLTSMRCGGVIARLFEPESGEELQGLIRAPAGFHLLGAGTNTIFADTTIHTPVIRLGPSFDFIERVDGGLRAGGATPVKKILSRCVKDGLTGMEFMAGIPGTLGGALAMNAGTAKKGIMEVVREIEAVDASGPRTIDPSSLPWGYRRGGIEPGTVVTAAVLALEPSTTDEVRARILEHLEKRRNQPRGPSAGSVFKNPPEAPAGLLIDRAGLKGTRVGGAKVSELHANFIVNDEGASATDVAALIALVKRQVFDRFGIELHEEVRFIGQ